jgi:hypothetical protein
VVRGTHGKSSDVADAVHQPVVTQIGRASACSDSDRIKDSNERRKPLIVVRKLKVAKKVCNCTTVLSYLP